MSKEKRKIESMFEIIDEGSGKRKVISSIVWVIATLLLSAFIMAAILFICSYAQKHSSVETIPIETKPVQNIKQYEYDKKIYEDAGIDYSYDDWEQDQKVDDSEDSSDGAILGPSAAQKSFEEKVNDLLDEFGKLTLVDTDYYKLITSLNNQIDNKLFFIDSHFGWPEEMDDGRYDGVRSYIDRIVLSFTGEGDLKEGIYGESLSTLQAELRNCLFTEKQYRTGYSGVTDKMYDVYKCWGNDLGFMDIGEIKMLWFTPYEKLIPYDHLGANCEAKVLTNNGYFIIYLLDMDNDHGERDYRIIDIKEAY